jgi:predicted regulator of Ras-like GTPase activity (Roadblock/LC7/MglB family)
MAAHENRRTGGHRIEVPGHEPFPEPESVVVEPRALGPAERLQASLREFQDRVDGVRGIAIADKSGLPVATSFSSKANVLTVTAMSTMAVQSSRRVFENLALAGPSEVVMVGSDVTVFVSSMPESGLSLIVVLEMFANLGLVRIEVARLSRDIGEILGL